MPNLIGHNAYRILGLDNSANQKDILKRYKEIINRLKIDDYPKYDLDVNLPDKFRTEESVNDALKRLQNVKNNLTEYFFWFHIADTVDENALNYLQYGDATSYDQAILIWKNASETENSTGLFYKKNLTVLYCLTLFHEENDTYLKESLSNWKEIVNSDKFWITFEKRYGMNNDQTINANMICEFRENVVKYISDIYHDLYLQFKNTKYVKDFQDVFGTLGEKTEKNLLKPIHQSIYETIGELNKLELEENDEKIKIDNKCDNCGDAAADKYFDYDDGSTLCVACRKKIGKEWKNKIDNLEETVEGSKKKLNQIQKVITKLESQLDQLRQMGLYEDSQSKLVRDHVAEAIRDVSVVKIHNEEHMSTKSAELLNLAIKIAGTESIKEQYESDLKKIQEIANHDENTALVLPIPKFLGKKDLIVKNNFMEYKGKKIYYEDIVEISYHNKEEKFNFAIMTSKDKIDLTFSNQQDLWLKLINIAKQFIEPVIVTKLVKSILEQDQTILIGNISIDKSGFHKSKFLKGIDSILWDDETVYTPKLFQGTVVLYKDKNNTPKHFATIPLENSNAPVLAELIITCHREFLIRHQK